MAYSKQLADAGAALVRKRRARQWTQVDASKQIEVLTGVKIPPQELSRLETGQTLAPNAETLSAVGTAYSMDPNEMMELYGYWKPTDQPARELPEQGYEILRELNRLRPGTVDQLLETFELLIQAAIQRDRRRDRQDEEQHPA
jgi:transcriptional regulator with XRE-family HTH domain